MSHIYEALRRSQALSRGAQRGSVPPAGALEPASPSTPEDRPPATASSIAAPSHGEQFASDLPESAHVDSAVADAVSNELPSGDHGCAPDDGSGAAPHSQHSHSKPHPPASRSPRLNAAARVEPARGLVSAPREVDAAAVPLRLRETERGGQDLAFELRRLIGMLFRRKWEVALIACLVVIPVSVATYRAQRLYRSTAQVQIDPEPLQVLPYPDIDQPGTRPHFELFMRTQEQVLRGSALRERVAARLRTDPNTSTLQGEIGRLGGAFSVQRLENTQIYRLGYVAAHPETAARMANIFAEEYIKFNFENRQAVRVKAKELLERELEKLEEKVQSSDRQLVDYAHRNSIPTADPGLSTTQLKITGLSNQLSDAEAQLIVEQSKLAKVQSASVAHFPDTLNTPMILAAKGKVAQLEQELVVLRSTFGENWPTVIQKRAEIKLAQEQLDRERGSALSHAEDQALGDYQLADEKRRRLAASLAEHKKLAQSVETALVQYNIIRREVDTSQKMYEAMLERLKQTSMAAGMEFGGFHLIESAAPSYAPASPNTRANLALACLLGLGLGVCIAFGREFWNASIRTVDELEQFTVMPVLGSVPHLSAREKSREKVLLLGEKLESGVRQVARLMRVGDSFVTLHPRRSRADWENASAEAIRNVCASILLSRSGRPPRRIMMTSALSGEGKTTVARQVSLAFAESGARTLLVECDLRRPTFAARFGIGNTEGLTLYLSGHGGPFPTIHPTDNSNLFLVPAGPSAPNPPALLNSERMQAFLEEASASFQFVILDTPPVLPVADARVLAPLTEGVILVIRAGATSRRAIRRVTALLEDAGTLVLGSVLNASDPRDLSVAGYAYYSEYRRADA